MNRGAASRSFTGPADGQTVARVRTRLRDWLDETVDIDGQRCCDIVLAVSEALTNCAEHAYQSRAVKGAMTLSVVYDPEHAVLELMASDDGSWLEAVGSGSATGIRGRGLPLIRALADDCTVDGHPLGTTVRMRFHQCPARIESSARVS